ncbi:MAG: HDOD domain-containing protein [Desulfobulbaceae bacterium]|nr:HDOD domain-containing protein [Desulfobulbaceae bacterium]
MKNDPHALLQEKIQEGYCLPSLSIIALKLVRMAADDATCVETLVNLIKEDPALSARLIRLANSAFFRTKVSISSLPQAVNRVGFQRLRMMALSLSLRDSFPMGKVGSMDYERFWQTSICRALLTSSLARHLKTCDQDDAFTAGLTLELGLLVFFDLFIRDKEKDVDLTGKSLYSLLNWQYDKYGIDHRQIGKELLRQWNFPDDTIECQQLSCLENIKESTSELARVSCLAMELTWLIFQQPDAYQPIFTQALKIFGLQPDEIDTILQKNFIQFQEIANSLISSPSDEADMTQLMVQAHNVIGRILDDVPVEASDSLQQQVLNADKKISCKAAGKKESGLLAKGTTLFDRYCIEKLLGKGSMGYVYLAYDNNLTRKVAIKMLRLDRLHSDDEKKLARNYFLQEARVTGNLNHGHITTVYDIGIDKGSPYFIMEYIEGENLQEHMDKRLNFSLPEKISIISMVARALSYAHQRGIIHRDIKPTNIMILKNRLPKITDFGIARVMEAKALPHLKKLVPDGGFFGTPRYMSPEQIMGKKLDNRTDIFSLGVLAYHWISNEIPFKGANVTEVLKAVLKKTPAPLSDISEADRELEKIINLAMEKSPKKRFQNIEDFSDALELYIDKKTRTSGLSGKKSLFSYDQKEMLKTLQKKYVFFSNFTIDELLTIFKLASQEKFKKGEYVIREGTNGTKIYIIIRGSMAVVKDVDGQKIEVSTLPSGSCVGEMAIIDRMPRSASVIARETTQALSINETVLRHLQPKLCLKLYRNLAAIISERLRNLTQKR